MKSIVSTRIFTLTLAAAATAAMLLVEAPLPARAQSGQVSKPATAKPPVPSQTAARDYLVQVGKHVMWKSQVEAMHPEMKKQAVPISKANNNDFAVQVGKRTVMASTLRRDPKDAKTKPSSHGMACKDYLVQSGKQAVWASAANCPMGKHSAGVKPLCCVVPSSDPAKLPRCCADAAK